MLHQRVNGRYSTLSIVYKLFLVTEQRKWIDIPLPHISCTKRISYYFMVTFSGLDEKEMETLNSFPVYTISGNAGIITPSPCLTSSGDEQCLTNSTVIDTSKTGTVTSYSAFTERKTGDYGGQASYSTSPLKIYMFSERL